jgi:hypothetical protein
VSCIYSCCNFPFGGAWRWGVVPPPPFFWDWGGGNCRIIGACIRAAACATRLWKSQTPERIKAQAPGWLPRGCGAGIKRKVEADGRRLSIITCGALVLPHAVVLWRLLNNGFFSHFTWMKVSLTFLTGPKGYASLVHPDGVALKTETMPLC